MSNHRQLKLQEVLAQLAGQFLVRNANLESLITVTHAAADDEGNRVVIFVSVMPDNMATKAIAYLKRERSEFREYIKKYSALQHPPTIDFMLDIGEKNRQRIFELTVTKPTPLSEMNAPDAEAPVEQKGVAVIAKTPKKKPHAKKKPAKKAAK